MSYRIYLITNLITRKLYVGQTDNTIQERFNQHVREAIRHDNTCYLHNSILKYGPESFIIELVEDSISEEDIDQKEAYYIDKVYHTFYLDGNGYNMTHGGQGIHGYKHTDETKKKISESIKLAWEKIKSDPDRYLLITEERSNRAGYHWDQQAEGRKILSDLASKRIGDLNPFYGKTHSEEVKQQISKSNSIPIQMLDLSDNVLMEFKSGHEASIYLFEHQDEFINISATKPSTLHTRISQVLRGKAKTAYGYKWKIKCID